MAALNLVTDIRQMAPKSRRDKTASKRTNGHRISKWGMTRGRSVPWIKRNPKEVVQTQKVSSRPTFTLPDTKRVPKQIRHHTATKRPSHFQVPRRIHLDANRSMSTTTSNSQACTVLRARPRWARVLRISAN